MVCHIVKCTARILSRNNSYCKKRFLRFAYTIGTEQSKNISLHAGEAKSLLNSKSWMTQQLGSGAGVLQGSGWVAGVQSLPKGSRSWHLVSVGSSMTVDALSQKETKAVHGHCFLLRPVYLGLFVGYHCPLSEKVFPNQLILSGNGPTTDLQVCLPGDSRASWVDDHV